MLPIIIILSFPAENSSCMRRRRILKQIGATSAAAIGATGFASARTTGRVPLSEAKYVTVEIDGETRDLTLEEFDQHPDTQSLSDLDPSAECCYECKECCDACCYGELCCWGRECGTCPGC